LEGVVENGTPGGAAIGADLPVSLHVFRGEAEVLVEEATTDANGTFRFEGLDTDPALEYWPEIEYQGVSYISDVPLQFEADQNTLMTSLTVYEPTADDSEVFIASVHMIVEAFDQVLRVSEIHLFGNSGQRTYVGEVEAEGDAATLSIPLPENAVGLAFEQEGAEGRYIEVDGGVLDTEPVPPGTDEPLTFLSYHLMSGDGTVSLTRSFAYPVADLNLLVVEALAEARSDQLQDRGLQQFQGRQYRLYTAEGLGPEQSLNLELVVTGGQTTTTMPGSSSVTSAGTTKGNQALLRWLGLGVLALAVVGAVVFSISKRERPATPTGAQHIQADPQARQLLRELADIEDAYEAGDLDRATYQRQKAAKYRALRSL
jgi:hypothetical protein